MLAEKVVLITGASRGIGKEIALEFAKNGAKVIINYHQNDEAANIAVSEIGKFTSEIQLYKADISNYNDAQQMISMVLDKYCKIDILVNNAGINMDKFFMSSTPDDWNKVINTNLFGVFNCCQNVLLAMIRQRAGRIINIASVSAYQAEVGQAIYAASKAGVIAFSKVLAKEVGRWNITVNTIIPGFIKTDMTKDIFENNLQDELKKIPLNRVGETRDVAKLVIFLAGCDADYITGAVIPVDGGLLV